MADLKSQFLGHFLLAFALLFFPVIGASLVSVAVISSLLRVPFPSSIVEMFVVF